MRIGRSEGQTNLVRTREGRHRLYLSVDLLRHAPVDAGNRVRVELRPDPRGAEPELPGDLVAALHRVPGCLAALRSRSRADRRQLVRWIGQARSAAAREHRIARVIVQIRRRPPRRTARGGR